MSEGRAIEARRSHGVIGINHVNDAHAARRDLSPPERSRIARAVPVFVMKLHDGQVILEASHAFENAAADGGMLLELSVFVGGKFAGFAKKLLSSTPILPISCSSAPMRTFSTSAGDRFMARAIFVECSLTRRLWPAV